MKHQSLNSTFGGSRIENGEVAVTVWSDGVVIASAWSVTDPRLDGQIFTFRGEIKPPAYGRNKYRLVDADECWVDDFITVKACMLKAQARAIGMAFAALNAQERAARVNQARVDAARVLGIAEGSPDWQHYVVDGSADDE